MMRALSRRGGGGGGGGGARRGGPQKSTASLAPVVPLRSGLGGARRRFVVVPACALQGGDAVAAGRTAATSQEVQDADGGSGGARAAAAAEAAAAAGAPRPDDDDDADNNSEHPISAFYAALSRRDLAALRELLHPDVTYENLAVAGTSGPAALRGPAAVSDFFADALSGVERGARFEVDDWALGGGGRPAARAAAVWRLVSPGAGLLARGVTFFRLSAGGGRRVLVEAVVDAPEHAVKTPRAGLAMAAPLAPAVQMLSESLASSLDALAAAAFGGGGGGGSGGGGGGGAAAAAMSAAAAAAAAWASAPAPPQQQQWQAVSSPPSSSSSGAPAAAASTAGAEGREAAAGGATAEAPAAAAAAASAAAGPPPDPLDPSALAGLWQRDPQRTDMASLDASLELLGLGRLQRLTARLIDGMSVEVAGGPPAGVAAAGQQPQQQHQQQLTVSFLTSVPVFRVTERVPLMPASAAPEEEQAAERWWASELSGPRAGRLARRDLRPGRAAGVARRRRPASASLSAAPAGPLELPVLEVRTQWQAPVAGSLRETYSLVLPAGAPASAPASASAASASAVAAAAASAPELVVTAVTEVAGRGSVVSRAVYVRARAGATAAEILAEGRARNGGSVGEAMRRQGL